MMLRQQETVDSQAFFRLRHRRPYGIMPAFRYRPF
jgi:hypothetical protein